jgi:outer membrane protein
MLRLIIGALITLSLVLGPLGTLAAELRIGTADPDAILAGSPEGKRVQDAIKQKTDELGRPLGTKRQDLGRQVEEFQKQAGMMKEDARRVKAQELEKKMADFDRQAADAEKQLNQFKENQLAPLSRKMETALEQVAKEEKLDMILDHRLVLYLSNKAMNVNDKVRAKFMQ